MTTDKGLELECTLCTKEGKHGEAMSFCQECEAYICSSCENTHARFPALRNHTIVSRNAIDHTDSTALSDVSNQFGKLSTQPSDVDSETKPQNYGENQKSNSSTEPSDADVTERPFSKPSIDLKTVQHNNMIDIAYASKVNKVKNIDVSLYGDKLNCCITGCCFLSEGELVLYDFSNKK